MPSLPRVIETSARWAYGGLLWLLTPFYLLRLWRRGQAEPLYRVAMGERFGFYQRPAAHAAYVWVHAVSLGETRAAAALISALRVQLPNLRLLLTHSTATGREAGAALLHAGDAQTWLPFDTPGAVRRFFRHWQPAIGVLMETEIWPNLLFGAERAAVKMVLANARLSARSERRGARFSALLYPAARRLSLVLAQTEGDAERLRASAAPHVRVAGNLKYDMAVDAALLARGRQWHQLLNRPVLLLAVSREGEEAMLLEAWCKLPLEGRPLLLIVPRHPQRFDEVAALITDAGLTLARRSSWQDLPPAEALSADAWLGDSMREMPLYYAMAQVALLGGSFAPLGGQNLIEAAACACPVVMGAHTFNFAEAAALALDAGAALRAADMAQGMATGLSLCADPAGRAQMADAAQRFSAQHRGAAQRMALAIVGIVPRPLSAPQSP